MLSWLFCLKQDLLFCFYCLARGMKCLLCSNFVQGQLCIPLTFFSIFGKLVSIGNFANKFIYWKDFMTVEIHTTKMGMNPTQLDWQRSAEISSWFFVSFFFIIVFVEAWISPSWFCFKSKLYLTFSSKTIWGSFLMKWLKSLFYILPFFSWFLPL